MSDYDSDSSVASDDGASVWATGLEPHLAKGGCVLLFTLLSTFVDPAHASALRTALGGDRPQWLHGDGRTPVVGAVLCKDVAHGCAVHGAASDQLHVAGGWREP